MRIDRYDELTWAEIEALPRAVPLLLPLGLDGYDHAAAARRLRAQHVVVLPAVPYGLAFGDGRPLGRLALPRPLLRRTLRGVLRELSAQGFTRLVLLDAHRAAAGLDLRPARVLAIKAPPAEARPWPGDLGAVVTVVSTGHTEQHAHHLPCGTDTFIAEAIAEGLAQRAGAATLCLPAWPYGASTHTREFPGTLDLGGRLFEDLFLALVGRLVQLGARAVYFANAHGGNHSYLVNVVKTAGERWPQAFVATEWLHTTGPALERLRSTARGGMGHAGELETSYLLHLRPDLVRRARAVPETDFVATPNYWMDWIEGGRLIANPPWRDDTTTGAYGDPTAATAEKGRQWLQAAVDEKLEALAEIVEQQHRRQARRAARARGRLLDRSG